MENTDTEGLKAWQSERLQRTNDASGGIEHYALSLGYKDKEALVADLEGKNVLNIGSGRGLFEREIKLSKINCKVTSVEPKLRKAGYRQQIASETRGKLSAYEPPKQTFLSKLKDRVLGKVQVDPIEEADKAHDERAIAGIGFSLSFKENSFDLIFDVSAVTWQSGWNESMSGEEEKLLYKLYLSEAYRVLKPGGFLMIHDPSAFEWLNQGRNRRSWKEEAIKEVDYPHEYLYEEGYTTPIGVKIQK